MPDPAEPRTPGRIQREERAERFNQLLRKATSFAHFIETAGRAPPKSIKNLPENEPTSPRPSSQSGRLDARQAAARRERMRATGR